MTAKLPDLQAGAPRKPVSEQRAEPLASELRSPPSEEEIRALIAEVARQRARRRGVALGYEPQDWIEAETEVMVLLGLWQ